MYGRPALWLIVLFLLFSGAGDRFFPSFSESGKKPGSSFAWAQEDDEFDEEEFDNAEFDEDEPLPGEKQSVVNSMAPGKPFPFPDGPARSGWELLWKNDFAAAETAFQAVLNQDPNELKALEGLFVAAEARGKYRDAALANLRLVRVTADSPLCAGFVDRAMDMLQLTEIDEETCAAFLAASDKASPANSAVLRDMAASLKLRLFKPAEAKALLAGLGYVDRWHFVAGPFGRKDRNNSFEKRYAPEEPLKNLTFQDEPGRPIPLKTNVAASFRGLMPKDVLPQEEEGGVFYAFTNLESDVEREVVLGLSCFAPAVLFLRGLPLIVLPDERPRARETPLVRVKLAKGANPLLLKFAQTHGGEIAIRVMDLNRAPIPGVVAKELTPEDLAAHKTSSVRGFLFSKEELGALAEYFLTRLSAGERTDVKTRFSRLVGEGRLDLAEANWFRFVLNRENDLRAKELLARTLVAAAPDSVVGADWAAQLLVEVGFAGRHADLRFGEEAKRLREHALTIKPDAVRQLLALADFFAARRQKEQAMEKRRTAAALCAESATAQAELAQAFENDGDPEQAGPRWEEAARLDAMYKPAWRSFRERHDDPLGAREELRREYEAGKISPQWQFHRMLSKGRPDEAEKALARLETDFPEQKDVWRRMRAELLTEQGRLEDAAAQWAALAAERPNDRQVLLKRVDLAVRLKKDEEAVELLNAYLRENPSDFDLRRRAEALSGKPREAWWKPYDVAVQAIDTSNFTLEKFPRATYAWIVDFGALKINPDLSSESYTHIAQKVLNQEGINQLSEALVRAQGRDIIMLRTLTPDGSSFEPDNVFEFNFARAASHYKVGPGAILEHAYVERQPAAKDDPYFHVAFNFYELDAPRAVSRWVVLIPDALKDKLQVRKIRPELVDEKILPGPTGYTAYQWTNKGAEGIKVEPFMPKDEVVPMVEISSASPAFRGSGLLLLRRPPTELPPEAEAFAKQHTAEARTAEEKFERIVVWVQNNISVGKEARSLEDVWWMHSGRPEQAAELAVALCRVVDLPVKTAYVNTAYRSGSWRSKYARRQWEPDVLAGFRRHPLLVFEDGERGDVWRYFGNSPLQRHDPSFLPRALQSAQAVTIDDEGARFRWVDAHRVDRSSLSIKHIAALNRDGGAVIETKLGFFGTLAGKLREVLSDPRREIPLREDIANRFWPGIKINAFAVENKDNVRLPVRLEFSGSAPGLTSKRGEEFALRPFRTPPALLSFTGPQDREYDLIIRDEVYDFDFSFRWIAPPECAWTEVPDDLFMVTEFGWYCADFNVSGRNLYCTRSFFLPQQRISPEKYKEFQAFLKRISDTESRPAVFCPVTSSGVSTELRAVFSGGYADNGAVK